MVMALLAAAAGAAAVWFSGSSPAVARERAQVPAGRVEPRLPGWVPAVGVALAVVAVVGGVTGILGGLAAGVATQRHLRKLRSRRPSDDTARRTLELPLALDVLGACLTVGATQQTAVDAVARGMGGSLQADLRRVSGAMRVGADAAEAWSLVESSDLHALGAALSRAQVTGAPVAPLLTMLADQCRQRSRAVAMDAARALGVHSTGPLGLCFLPAFVLVAVVPLVASLVPGLG